MRESLYPKNFVKPIGPYVQGVKCQPKTLIFVSGQVAWNEKGEVVGKDDVKTQARQALENLKTVLEEGGASIEDVVKVTVYLTNIDHIKEVAEVRAQFFTKNLPASTLIQVPSLARKDLLIEIEAIAALE